MHCLVQVRSLTLDVKVWDQAVLGMMERIGNDVANEAWEAELLNENARFRDLICFTVQAISMPHACMQWQCLHVLAFCSGCHLA